MEVVDLLDSDEESGPRGGNGADDSGDELVYEMENSDSDTSRTCVNHVTMQGKGYNVYLELWLAISL